MNKITTVNLGGYPFTIDEDAYNAINKYLGAIAAHFADSEGCDEILDDIEVRISELLNDYLSGKSIVTMKEYHAVVKVMGRPEDFGAEPIDDAQQETPSASQSKSKSKNRYSHIKTGKRLFRDPDEKVIGGVCSGVAAYFGIADPLWVRLGFIGLVFIGGISVLLYPILWAIVPTAETAGDKLQMRGEPATVSNIAKTVEEELTELSNKITEMSKDLGSKKKFSAASTLSPRKAISGVIGLFGKGVLGIVKLLRTIFKPIFSLVLGILLLSLGIAWAAWIVSYLSTFTFINYIGPSPTMLSSIGGLALFFTVAIPILGLMLMITRWFSSYRIPEKWRTNLRLGWVASFILSAVMVFMTVMSFNHEAEFTQVDRHQLGQDVITIGHLDQPKNSTAGFMNMGGVKYGDGALIHNEVHFDITKADGEEVVIETEVRSRGRSYDQARQLAESISADYLIKGSEILIPNTFRIESGNKFRAQRIHYTIKIPVGKTVAFSEEVGDQMGHGGFTDSGHRRENYSDYHWTMTPDGLESTQWQDDYNASKILDIDNLANLNINGEVHATITYGPTNKVELTGMKADIDKVESIISGETTNIILKNWTRRSVELSITTPRLDVLSTNKLLSLKIEGYKQDAMEINYGGRSNRSGEVQAYVDVKELICNISGSNEVDLIGTGDMLNINILEGALVKAAQYKAKSVKVSGNIYHGSTFYASDAFDYPEHERNSLTLFGNPELLNKTTQ